MSIRPASSSAVRALTAGMSLIDRSDYASQSRLVQPAGHLAVVTGEKCPETLPETSVANWNTMKNGRSRRLPSLGTILREGGMCRMGAGT